MAKNEVQKVTSADPQQLTAGDVASITLQNQSRHSWVRLFPSINAAAPAKGAAVLMLPPGQALINESLSDLFPGVAGANRVFGQSEDGAPVPVLVSHA